MLAIPDRSSRAITEFRYTYDVLAPPLWRARIISYNDDFSASTVLLDLNPDGTRLQGTQTIAVASAPRLVFQLLDTSTTSRAFNGETGSAYAKLTNLSVKTKVGTITATDIAKHILQLTRSVHPVNATQVRASHARLQSMPLDLPDFTVEDQYPGAVLQELVGKGAEQGRSWEVGVDAQRYLYLRAQGSTGRRWFVDVADDLEAEHTLDTLANSVYPVYTDANGAVKRGTTLTDTVSVARHGLVRRKPIDAQTTSATYAGSIAKVALTDSANPLPRAGIVIREIYDANGAPWPLYEVRPGDTITIINFSPSLSTAVDRIKTLTITEVEYAMHSDTLIVTPAVPLTRKPIMVAQTRKRVVPRRGRSRTRTQNDRA